MQELGHQLGGLFLEAAPIALILLVFYGVMRALFFGPLLKVMEERESRTAGARKAAEAAQANAAERMKQYQNAIKHARAQVYAEQEAERKKLLDERAARLKDSRNKASADVEAGKERIAKELAAARRELEGTIGQLSAEIVQRVLQPPRPGSPAGGAR